MSKKGQLSIEIIVLLAIFLLFFQAMLLPSIEFSENVLKDTHTIVQTKKSIDSLSDNIEQFANSQGYGKRNIYFYLPSSAAISCDNTPRISYKLRISPQKPVPAGCDYEGGCGYTKNLYISNNISCNNIGPGYNGTLTIEKSESGNITLTIN